MSPQALALRDSKGFTALHSAAMVGNTEAAIAMLDKFPDLLYVLCFDGRLPVKIAAMYSQRSTLEYLISMSKPNVKNSPFEGQLGIDLLIEIIVCEFLDVALDLVEKYPDLARLRLDSSHRCALSYVAEMDTVFVSRVTFKLWDKLFYYNVPLKQYESRATSVAAGDIEAPTHRRCSTSFQIISEVGKQFKYMIWNVMERLVPRVKIMKDERVKHIQAWDLTMYLCREMKLLPESDARIMFQDSIFRAAEHGLSEVVQVIMYLYPVVTCSLDSTYRNIMHMAASKRFKNVFNLIYSMSDRKHLFSCGVDTEGNSLLHMCARLASTDRLNLIPGAALQMQRELQWFNEVQRFVPPSRRKCLNKDGKTPRMLFTEQHLELKEQGEKWMKETASACSIATALIATVVFAAAFTVPGGVSSETGIPVFSEKPAFVLFATTNAVSMFTSITSLMMFLSILTSRYAEEDFLHVLPKRLCYGLLSLFISVLFMLVAFSAALYLVFHKKLLWFIIPVAAFGWWPVASFVLLQFPLLVEVMYSTFGPGVFHKAVGYPFY